MESTLPAGWKSQLSVTQRKLYYINMLTNQRQWLIPTEPAQSTSTAFFNRQATESASVADNLSGNEEDPFAEPSKSLKVCSYYFLLHKRYILLIIRVKTATIHNKLYHF